MTCASNFLQNTKNSNLISKTLTTPSGYVRRDHKATITHFLGYRQTVRVEPSPTNSLTIQTKMRRNFHISANALYLQIAYDLTQRNQRRTQKVLKRGADQGQ